MYDAEDYATMHPSTRTLARVLFGRLGAADLDDTERTYIYARIALLRAGHYGDFSSLPGLPIKRYFVSLLREYIEGEEATRDTLDDIEADMLNDSLAPFRGLLRHLDAFVPSPVSTDAPTSVIAAFDIEATGSDARSSVVAIGVCVGTPDGKVLTKQRWCLEPLHGDIIDPDCWTEFWADPERPENMVIWNEIQEAAKHPAIVVAEFTTFLRTLAATYERVKIVSDNPAFDTGMIDALLHRVDPAFGSLRYLGGKTYRSIGDPGQMLKGAYLGRPALKQEYEAWRATLGDKVKHDHRPENDAESIYYDYVFLLGLERDISTWRAALGVM